MRDASEHDDGNEEDLLLAHGCEEEEEDNTDDVLFDLIVGTIEDLLMDDDFVDFQNSFMERNASHFSTSPDDENKLIYMDIFSSYTSQVEAYIEKKLRAEIPEFSMSDFLDLLRSRSEQLEGDVFDMMASIGDFQIFKEMMVSYRQDKEGTGIDLSGLLAVTNSKSLAVAAGSGLNIGGKKF
ncbi:the ARF-like 2 binding protein BART-domain-containing protein [Chytriomyces sp. MP71]|nr:the ARF-like 2 binding protein BART-domain-containing protein [Chytriomyces sp. MP71]